MILEGIVTTVSIEGALNIAPMGPFVDSTMEHLILRPFRTSQTYRNLKARGEGVFHVTDDVLLLAQAALGPVEPTPDVFPAARIRGHVLKNCCRFYEFRVSDLDDRGERTRIETEVVHSGTLREFFGFNRGKHAVVEAAILATRTGFLPLNEIQAEYRKLNIIIDKTGGAQEHRAFQLLKEHVEQIAQGRLQSSEAGEGLP